MEQDATTTTVIIVDSKRCLIARNLDADTALTLIALVSEDPADWDEAMSVWPRYQTPAVCEFVSSLPFEPINQSANDTPFRVPVPSFDVSELAVPGAATREPSFYSEPDIDAHEPTMPAVPSATTRELPLYSEPNVDAHEPAVPVVIDFRNKRVLTGGQFMPVGRDEAFAMVVDESGNQRWPMSIHLPPWWEMHESVSPDFVNKPRQSPINKPRVDRDVLYGDPFLAEIAARILAAVDGDAWRNSEARDDERARYPFTVAIHRDWLMTPREDLGGRMPRELLHGAIKWIDRVTWGQRLRFEDAGLMVAAPNDWSGFATAPMGREEMCIYFDLCRELIEAGWVWCESNQGRLARQTSEIALEELIQFLERAKDDWLNSPFEGGSPPSFIIECDHRRVPRSAGVAIDGIDKVQTEQHVADCDCPICEMMADGMFGVAFTGIDGHHLELDDEFAFSMKETREEWEEQQREYAGFSADMDQKRAERETVDETDAPFESAWSGINDDDQIPGNSPLSGKQGGQLKMAFMVAEIVSELENCGAPRDEIKTLNKCFANYRRCGDAERLQRAVEFKANLQSFDDRYPQLVSKSADLQSHIDEAGRLSEANDSDLDSPF